MKKSFLHISHSLSQKLIFGIFGIVIVVFVLSLGFLFMRSRQIVEQEATERATLALNNTTLHLTKYLQEVETSTENITWLVLDNLQPDSLYNYSRRVVELSPNINGCSITMEPNFFPQEDSNFSVYSLREGGKIETAIEGDYNYYEKIWYSTPIERKEACWVGPYNDYQEGTLSSVSMIASYCKPLYKPEGNIIGVIATDISISKISEIISSEKPYPNSYCMMLGANGQYFVHPDRLKLIRQNILTTYDNDENPDIIAVGQNMIARKVGHKRVNIEGKPCLVFYQPVEKTGWSIALVCPEEDIFAGYKKLTYLLAPLILIGLSLILFFCWKTIKHFILPLDQLAQQSRYIAEGTFGSCLIRSKRIDVVGNLQNSFVTMQETINEKICNIQQVNAETERRNEELAKANLLAQEADKRKSAFIQEMQLQIRTPLNIIAGFMQVMQQGFCSLSTEEKEKGIDTMKQSSNTIKRMASMLFDASWKGEQNKFDCTKKVEVNAVMEDSIKDFNAKSPRDAVLNYTTSLPNPHYIHSNRLYLHRSVRELLYNAKKFASKNPINLTVDTTDTMIRIIVEDHGPGIPEDDRERVFESFVKLDNYSEGLGLGLGLTLQHSKNLGGSLTLDPTYKDGARFILEVPNA